MSSDPFDGRPGGFEYSTKGALTDFTTMFAGVLMLVSASFEILQGLSAIANDDLYAAGSDYLYKLDMTVWGWVHLVVGVLSAAVAIGILAGQAWAWLCGIIVVSLSMLTNFAALPHYPLWSLVVIAFDALIIWALCLQLGHKRP
ncbi:DUF7144 family membrane protein [Nocardioides caricicola]|uniref:DUF7144 domain-containing protein n=1 Tax=Nocardioides caricicola TaxID=634770 RepID=A0ABW0N703_9ACTN